MRLALVHSVVILLLAGACTAEPPASVVAPPEPPPEVTEQGGPYQGVFMFPTGPRLVKFGVVGGRAVFEGDILLSWDRYLGQSPGAQNVFSATLRKRADLTWTDGVVPYVIDTAPDPVVIEDAIAEWEAVTDIDFVERTTEPDYLVFVDNGGGPCTSELGRDGGPQEVGLNTACNLGNVVHELGHALGLYHEHTRTDRDLYVAIQWPNIEVGAEFAFEKWDVDIYPVGGRNRGPYDFQSVMHYSINAFSSNGLATILRVDGQPYVPPSSVPTPGDICGVEKLYGRRGPMDLNGDGYADLVSGVPAYDVTGAGTNDGAILIQYGSASGPSVDLLFHKNTPNVPGAAIAGGGFGTAVAYGDFDGDCYGDVVVGSPGATVSGLADAGLIDVMYGSGLGVGLRFEQIHADGADVAGAAQAGARFGATLAVGDFDGDGYDDVAIGSPDHDVGAAGNAGQVTILRGSASGLVGAGSEIRHQDVAGVEGVAAANEHFGAALAAGDLDGDGFDELVVGIPGTTVSGASNAGEVQVFLGFAGTLSTAGDFVFTQGSFGGISEASDELGASLAIGDFNGDDYDDLVVGIPYEESEAVGAPANTGRIAIFEGSAWGIDSGAGGQLEEGQAVLPGTQEGTEWFGYSLVAADFDADGFDDLAVGLPLQAVSGQTAAGGVIVIGGSSSGLGVSLAEAWHQDKPGVAGAAEAWDNFGTTLSAGDFDGDGRADLFVGSPYEDRNGIADTGGLHVIRGGPNLLTGSGGWFVHCGNLSSLSCDYYDRLSEGLATRR